jgi:hypothetical protein
MLVHILLLKIIFVNLSTIGDGSTIITGVPFKPLAFLQVSNIKSLMCIISVSTIGGSSTNLRGGATLIVFSLILHLESAHLSIQPRM